MPTSLDTVLTRIAELDTLLGRVSASPAGRPAGNQFAGLLGASLLAANSGTPAPALPSVDLAGLLSGVASTAPGAIQAGPASTPPTVRTVGGPGASAAYEPAFVTETDQKVWTDCAWASLSMLIDKMTGGAVRPDHAALRTASGDLVGGSTLADLVTGARQYLGLELRTGAHEGLTFDGLLARLSAGGGAVVTGNYSSLPASYTRHDPAFASKADSPHAMYVGTYDRAKNRVWLMDPLGRNGYAGEWISTSDLRAFVWHDSAGRVEVIATPPEQLAGPATVEAALSAFAAAAPRVDAPATIRTAALKAGLDPLLLSAYVASRRLDTTNSSGIAAAAEALARALGTYGRTDLALSAMYAAASGGSGPAGGGGSSAFIQSVLTRWNELRGGI